MSINTSQKPNLSNPSATSPGPSRDKVWLMFDRIAGKYDLLNHLLSFGFDLYWRRRMASYLPTGKGLSLLDLATGTGDQLISIMNKTDRILRAVGADMSTKMLAVAGKKIENYDWSPKVQLISGEGGKIDFPDDTFDVLTISFGIRNFSDLPRSLSEIRRVLKPAGRVLILEFSLPRNRVLRRLHLFYLRRILPFIGRQLSGDDYAYRYLDETIETFPYGDSFCSLLIKSGFAQVEAQALTGGIVMIYRGEK